jgi:hypothetical protein
MAKIKKIDYFSFLGELRGGTQIWLEKTKYSFSTLRKKNAKRGVRYGKRK